MSADASSFRDIDVRAKTKAWSSMRKRSVGLADTERVRTSANLRAEGVVIPLSEWLGHNNGPAWEDWPAYLEHCWRQAHKKAWPAPSFEIGVRRAVRARTLGITYRRYVLELLERGHFLNEDDITRASKVS